MTLLERIFGVETMARVREEARQAQARALAQSGARAPASIPAKPVLRPARRQAPSGAASQAEPSPVGAPQRVASAPPAIAGGFVDALPAEFPTSILGTAVVDTPPLLVAFASREALLAAIVFSEALAPPLGLR